MFKKDIEEKLKSTYSLIQTRCYNKKSKSYKDYWWRWIVCERNTVTDFIKDMFDSCMDHCNKHWFYDTTIDRIDVNKNYNKENCRWATKKEQSNNKRNKVTIEIDGKEYTVDEYAKAFSISRNSADSRIRKFKQWKLSEAALKHKWNMQQKDRFEWSWIEIDWVYYTPAKLAEELGIIVHTARNRINEYKKWKMSYESLMHRWPAHWTVAVVIDGKNYTAKEYSDKYWLDIWTWINRIKWYKKWITSYETLTTYWPRISNRTKYNNK